MAEVITSLTYKLSLISKNYIPKLIYLRILNYRTSLYFNLKMYFYFPIKLTFQENFS
jgi:hypothetical protein